MYIYKIKLQSWLSQRVSSRSSLTLLPTLAEFPPGHIKFKCLGLINVAPSLLGVPCNCVHPPPPPPLRMRWPAFTFLPASPGRRGCSECSPVGSLNGDLFPYLLPPSDAVLHLSAPVRGDAVADGRQGLE